MLGRVFHLVRAADPTARVATPTVANDQFERHGFVHCCFREQIGEIASWWFDADDDLAVLELDPSRLRADLRLEPSPTRWYPHLYGPIDTDAVVATHAIAAGAARSLPPTLADPPPGYRITGRVDGDPAATVCWRADGALAGHPSWIERAHAAVDEGLTVELLGGIVVPATLDRPYESFATLAAVTDEATPITRYDGDGFF